MSTSTTAIECRTTVLHANEHLVVCCEIDHFIPSGLTVPELFPRLRPQLVAGIEDAAVRDTDTVTPPRLPTVGMEVGVADPGLVLWVHSPATAKSDLNACLGRLEAIVIRFVAAEAGARSPRHRSAARFDSMSR